MSCHCFLQFIKKIVYDLIYGEKRDKSLIINSLIINSLNYNKNNAFN